MGSRPMAYSSSMASALGKVTRLSPPVDVPANLSSDLNGSNAYSDVTLPADSAVLKRTASQVFLIIRYSF